MNKDQKLRNIIDCFYRETQALSKAAIEHEALHENTPSGRVDYDDLIPLYAMIEEFAMQVDFFVNRKRLLVIQRRPGHEDLIWHRSADPGTARRLLHRPTARKRFDSDYYYHIT